MDHLRRHPLTSEWLRRHHESDTDRESANHRHYWRPDPSGLISEDTKVNHLHFGTGHSIFENSILPLIEAAEHEVLLVTCFWARSPTLDALNNALTGLSAKATASGRRTRVRIGFSSSSILQKLFHTTSLSGKQWPASKWQHALGLPSPETLSGLDMEVKSVFVLPFSVMHPKFVIIDRKRVLLPSCNVSWENWFEGCLDFSGPSTEQFLKFWANFWANDTDQFQPVMEAADTTIGVIEPSPGSPRLLYHQPIDLSPIPSIFLPSPHNRNPNFSFLPWQPCPAPPLTPLNNFLISAFNNATHEIYIQTPNLTAPPVLSALLSALKRGVDVSILTSERLMILEQLVTAGTTTARCIRRLTRRYEKIVRLRNSSLENVETGRSSRVGNLSVRFFEPARGSMDEGVLASGSPYSPQQPVQSHLKLTIVDGEWAIFGSGNMDRASWFTSQELGVAFFCTKFAAKVKSELDELMKGRSRAVYDGCRSL